MREVRQEGIPSFADLGAAARLHHKLISSALGLHDVQIHANLEEAYQRLDHATNHLDADYNGQLISEAGALLVGARELVVKEAGGEGAVAQLKEGRDIRFGSKIHLKLLFEHLNGALSHLEAGEIPEAKLAVSWSRNIAEGLNPREPALTLARSGA